jgi:hypothetical protein
METVAHLQISQLTKATRLEISRTKARAAVMPKLLAFLRSIFTRSDLDYATFQRLESRRTPQEMRRNGLY